MSRSNHTREFQRYSRRRAEATKVGHYGLAVFRGEQPQQFEDVFDAMQERFRSSITRPRNGDSEHPTAVTLLDRTEVKRQTAIGAVAIGQARDTIYENAQSLRQTLTVRLEDLTFMGRDHNHSHSLALTFDEQSEQFLDEERAEILSTVEGMADYSYNYSWARKRPHITLAKVLAGQRQFFADHVIGKIEDFIPDEITLSRAVII